MKSFNIFLVVLVLSFSCKEAQKTQIQPGADVQPVNFTTAGKQFDAAGARLASEMLDKYNGLQVTDTLTARFKARVTEVCQAKGCWMKVELEDGQEAMIRFKDYGFFVPKDIAGKQVVVNGLAFVEEMSVEDQRHFAKDGGESPEVIAAIKAPKKTYGFEADGVLIPD